MFNTVLLPIDLNEESSWSKALPVALFQAQGGGNLNLLTVVPGFGENVVATYFPTDYAERAVAAARQDMEDFRAERVPSDVPSKALVRGGTIYDEIIGAAEDIGADLIVIAAHRPALRDYLIGPNAARVVRHAKCSVLVVRD